MAGMKQDGQKALDVVRMLTEADSDAALRENFRKVAALFGVEDMLKEADVVSLANLAPTAAFDAAGSALPTSLPDAPPKYAYKPRMEGGIEKYLRDNWADYIKAGLLSRPDLKRIDPIAYKALHNWLGKPSNQLPADLVVPTKSERIDTQLEKAEGLEDAMRLAATKRARERRPRPR